LAGVLGVVLVLVLGLGAQGQVKNGFGTKAGGPTGEHPIRARLVSEHDALVPGGATTLALVLEIRSGWYTYWRNPGRTGLAINAEFDPPEGVRIDEALWPVPKRKVLPGDILDYVYTGQAVLLFPVEASADLEPGASVTISCMADWLVCEESCIPGAQGVELTLPVRRSAEATGDPVFASARARLASEPGAADRIGVEVEGGELRISAPGAERMIFFPYWLDEVSFDDEIGDGEVAGAALTIGVEGSIEPGVGLGEVEVVRDGKREFYIVAARGSGGG